MQPQHLKQATPIERLDDDVHRNFVSQIELGLRRSEPSLASIASFS
jgi:hypothetical protein